MPNKAVKYMFLFMLIFSWNAMADIQPHGPDQLQKVQPSDFDYPRTIRSSMSLPIDVSISTSGASDTPIDNRGTEFWVCF